MNKIFECHYCGSVVDFHFTEETRTMNCPACGGSIEQALEIDDDKAKEILHESVEKGEWDVVTVETRRGKFTIGIGPEEVRIRSLEYLFVTAPLMRDRNYVNP